MVPTYYVAQIGKLQGKLQIQSNKTHRENSFPPKIYEIALLTEETTEGRAGGLISTTVADSAAKRKKRQNIFCKTDLFRNKLETGFSGLWVGHGSKPSVTTQPINFLNVICI